LQNYPNWAILPWEAQTAGIWLAELRSLLCETCQLLPIPSSLLDALYRFTESGGWEALAAFFNVETFVNHLEANWYWGRFAEFYATFVTAWIENKSLSSLNAMANHVRPSLSTQEVTVHFT